MERLSIVFSAPWGNARQEIIQRNDVPESQDANGNSISVDRYFYRALIDRRGFPDAEKANSCDDNGSFRSLNGDIV